LSIAVTSGLFLYHGHGLALSAQERRDFPRSLRRKLSGFVHVASPELNTWRQPFQVVFFGVYDVAHSVHNSPHNLQVGDAILPPSLARYLQHDGESSSAVRWVEDAPIPSRQVAGLDSHYPPDELVFVHLTLLAYRHILARHPKVVSKV
jgi:hypothetical protein